MLDRAVLAGGVHRLEDEQHRPAVLRVKLVLLLGQPLDAAREQLLRAGLVLGAELARVGRIEILEPEALALDDPVRLDEAANGGNDVLARHAGSRGGEATRRV